MLLHKFADGTRCKNHYTSGNDHRNDHDGKLIHHADSRNDRIKGENNIKQHDLDDHIEKSCRNFRGGVTFLAFQLIVTFTGPLPKKEEAARQKDQIAISWKARK